MKTCRPIPALSAEDRFRFWANVAIGKPNECWIWQAGCLKGYGRFGLCSSTYRANRIVAFLTYGPPPKGLIARHTCDNPSCCNPFHILWDTQKANIQDLVKKQRHWLQKNPERMNGTAHPRAVLTDEIVRQIRRLAGTPAKAVAIKLGIHLHNVDDVRRGRWSHVK